MEEPQRSNITIFFIRLCWSVRCCSVCSKFRTALRNGKWRTDTVLCDEIRKQSTDLYHREAKLSRWYHVEIVGSLNSCEAVVSKDGEIVSVVKMGYVSYLNSIFLLYNPELSPIDCQFRENADGNILTLAQRTALRDKKIYVYKNCTVCSAQLLVFRGTRSYVRRRLPFCFGCENSIKLFFSPI